MTKTLKLEESTAKEIYKTAGSTLKVILEETFGKAFLSEKITDKIKSWDDVCEHLGIHERDILPYRNPKTKQERSINAATKIQKISEVLNEGWIPDFTNKLECKYYPYFERKSSGWFLGSDSYGYGIFGGGLGFGFYFKSSELAIFAGSQFLDTYKEYLPD